MHGLQTIVFLNQNNRARAHLNATDPGHREQRRAEADLAEALKFLDAVIGPAPDGGGQLGDQQRLNFPPDFSVTRHADEAWVLPLTSNGQTLAAKIIPPGTRRYGLHYILTGEEGLAIADSIRAAN